jgi:hypothetical protein
VTAAGGIDPADFSLATGDRAVLQVTNPQGSARSVSLTVVAG